MQCIKDILTNYFFRVGLTDLNELFDTFKTGENFVAHALLGGSVRMVLVPSLKDI
jgi:hypothetical protein